MSQVSYSTPHHRVNTDVVGAPSSHAGRPTREPDPALGDKPATTLPQQLQHYPQWANWHHDKVIRNSRTGRNGSSTDISTWSTFAQAVKADPERLVFVFDRINGLVGLDVDGCRDPKTGELDARATSLIERFPTAYWEISLSGTGLHGIGYGVLPNDLGGTHPKGVGIFWHGRYFVMTGTVLPGHETLGRFDCDDLAAFYREVSPAKPKESASAPPTLTIDDHELIERLNREPGGKAARLLAGDATAYPDFSSSRFALATKIVFYTNDIDQVARIIRTSGLFKARDSERERDRKAMLDARNAVDQYVGPRYDPAYRTTRDTPSSPPLHVTMPTGSTSRGEDPTCSIALAEARARIVALEATITRQSEMITTLRERARLSDEREAIQRNAKLGTSRQTGAALATLFREVKPKEPDTPAGYRMPLAKLAERTGLSADTCSRQLKQLSGYRTADGTPVLHVETRAIPRQVNQQTGEIVEPHREVWVGPGVDRSAFGYILAQLAPANAPEHGGRPDRNACPEHPDAGVLRRTKTTRKITRECAHCHLVLDVQVIPVGRETTEHIPAGRPTQHHAFTHEGDDPETTDPIQHHAFGDDDASEPGLGPMPQHARSIDNHVGYDLSRILPDSPRLLNDAQPEPTVPPPGWEDEHRHVYGAVYRGGVTP